MSTLKKIKAKAGAIKKKFIKARGISSGSGKTSGRGHRGQKCRSGYSRKAGREGGQTPLYRRLPKRQTNTRLNRVVYSEVSLATLQKLADAGLKEIDIVSLVEHGVVKKIERNGIKVLARGELKASLKVTFDAFSEKAKAAIEAAGGSVVIASI